MATPSKGSKVVVIGQRAVTHPSTVVSTVQSVTTALEVTLILSQGFVEVAVNTDPARWFIDTSVADSGDDDWSTLQEILLTEDGTPADEAISGIEAIGSKAIEVVATTGFSNTGLIYIQDTGVVADGEWRRVEKLTTGPVAINLIAGLTKAKDSSDIIFGQAEIIAVTFNVESKVRYRVIYSHEGAAGANTHIKVAARIEESFG